MKLGSKINPDTDKDINDQSNPLILKLKNT